MEFLQGQDSLSLQEMIDCDIKTDLDSVLAGTDLNFSDLSSGSGLGLDLANGLESLDKLETMDSLDAPFEDSNTTLGSWMNLHTNTSNFSNSSFNMDTEAGSLMVNPSSVMPVNTSGTYTPLSTPQTTIHRHSIQNISIVCTTTVPDSTGAVINNPTTVQSRVVAPVQRVTTEPITYPHTVYNYGNTVNTQSVQVNVSNNQTKTVPVNHANQQPQKGRSKQLQLREGERAFPKPAYSYSCLIAMALKNSRTGSLPVSEIYSFMCEHFPYFKTAPNGWKNSVRHNLSLNKCFEKIEKPQGNGNQRKGCLWAMNPAKISKMEEEVQKWSRKDPMAIKNAMVYPGNLEMLERGDMKRDYNANMSGADSEDEEESSTSQSSSLTSVDHHVKHEVVAVADDYRQLQEPSLPEFQVPNGVYDELGDEHLNLGVSINSDVSSVPSNDMIPAAVYTTSTIQGNYVYTPTLSLREGSEKTHKINTIMITNGQP